jgi:hypothetical protein
VGDVKSGKYDHVTRQIKTRNKASEREEENPREI